MPSTPVAFVSPETDARASTTWRLQPPSASLVLWRKPRNPPSVAACALDPGVDATAAARSKLRSRLPFTAVHRTVHRPQHLHGSSPSTLDARVPAIQRPSARSHRTVDNSLITSRIEYSTFLIRSDDVVSHERESEAALVAGVGVGHHGRLCLIQEGPGWLAR